MIEVGVIGVDVGGRSEGWELTLKKNKREWEWVINLNWEISGKRMGSWISLGIGE